MVAWLAIEDKVYAYGLALFLLIMASEVLGHVLRLLSSSMYHGDDLTAGQNSIGGLACQLVVIFSSI